MMKRVILLTVVICLTSTGMVFAAGERREKSTERIKDRVLKKQGKKPAPETSTDTTTPITKPGDYAFSLKHDGINRMYIVHVPPTYNPAVPTPLIISLHGGGGDMNYAANEKNYGWISKSDKEGFIVVFPNGYSAFNSGSLATWNAGACCAGARDKNIDDVGFIRTMLQQLTKQLNVDQSRIFSTGMSNGGMMSYRLACEMTDIFKAIAPVAGTDNTTQCNPTQPISVLHIHAQDDTHVLFNGGAGKDAFKDRTKVTEFVSVPDTISRWVKFNRCNPTPKRVLENPEVYCDLYTQCAENVEVKLCVTSTGGHSWPGGRNIRGKKVSTAISANDEMWEFFKTK